MAIIPLYTVPPDGFMEPYVAYDLIVDYPPIDLEPIPGVPKVGGVVRSYEYALYYHSLTDDVEKEKAKKPINIKKKSEFIEKIKRNSGITESDHLSVKNSYFLSGTTDLWLAPDVGTATIVPDALVRNDDKRKYFFLNSSLAYFYNNNTFSWSYYGLNFIFKKTSNKWESYLNIANREYRMSNDLISIINLYSEFLNSLKLFFRTAVIDVYNGTNSISIKPTMVHIFSRAIYDNIFSGFGETSPINTATNNIRHDHLLYIFETNEEDYLVVVNFYSSFGFGSVSFNLYKKINFSFENGYDHDKIAKTIYDTINNGNYTDYNIEVRNAEHIISYSFSAGYISSSYISNLNRAFFVANLPKNSLIYQDRYVAYSNLISAASSLTPPIVFTSIITNNWNLINYPVSDYSLNLYGTNNNFILIEHRDTLYVSSVFYSLAAYLYIYAYFYYNSPSDIFDNALAINNYHLAQAYLAYYSFFDGATFNNIANFNTTADRFIFYSNLKYRDNSYIFYTYFPEFPRFYGTNDNIVYFLSNGINLYFSNLYFQHIATFEYHPESIVVSFSLSSFLSALESLDNVDLLIDNGFTYSKADYNMYAQPIASHAVSMEGEKIPALAVINAPVNSPASFSPGIVGAAMLNTFVTANYFKWEGLGFPTLLPFSSLYAAKVTAQHLNLDEFAPIFNKALISLVPIDKIYTSTEREQLLNNKVNSVKIYENSWVFNNNLTTAPNNSIFKEENIRRLANALARELKLILKMFVGRINNKQTREQVVNKVKEITNKVIDIHKYRPDDYIIICDETNNTDYSNYLYVDIAVKMPLSVKYVTIVTIAQAI